MAALDTPWLASMGSTSTYKRDDGFSSPQPTYDPTSPTVAAFSPQTLSGATTNVSKQRSTIIVHKKSPLLVATPPQVTRSLAYSHPFILPLNKLAGLLSWSGGDPWESFLMVAGFWAVVLYGDDILLWAGPVMVVAGLIVGMWSRRYSPLSSTSQTGEKHGASHKREPSDTAVLPQHKSLDEILETLREFTQRCNLLLDPFLRMTDFLSTQRTPTSATTRPALTTLFIRILVVTPLWVLLTMPPFYIITTRRVVLTCGTLILTWHSRPARVSRVILWRSRVVRRACAFITGLSFSDIRQGEVKLAPPPGEASKSQVNVASTLATKKRARSAGVRFTFIVYENQRRWLAIGWTYSMLAYERAAWTDEHLNPAPAIDKFELPDVEGGQARWRWVAGSEWRIEGGSGTSAGKAGSVKSSKDPAASEVRDGDGGGWIYYDNKWNDGKRQDGWGRYTRRRKWYRDAELVEVTSSTEVTPSPTPHLAPEPAPDGTVSDGETLDSTKAKPTPLGGDATIDPTEDANILSTPIEPMSAPKDSDTASTKSSKRRSGWFSGGTRKDRSNSKESSASTTGAKSMDTKHSSDSARSRDAEGEANHHDTWRSGQGERERHGRESGGWGVGEDAAMGLS